MEITIVGAGNVGTQFAVHAAEKGHNVTIYTSKPDKISKNLTIVNENNEVIHRGDIKLATNSEDQAFNNAEVIFVVVPAMFMEEISKKIEPYAKPGMKICIVPGTGGGECVFKRCITKGTVIFGVQRVPSVARLVEYGKCVRAIGYRDEMFVASLPHSHVVECSSFIESLFDIKCTSLPNYLNITLTPSNPILHTTRLRVLYKDYVEGLIYNKVPLFYEDWDTETSKLLLECDDEIQNICKHLKDYDLSYVKSLKEHYESFDELALTNKIRSIKGFKGLTSPTVKVENGYIPDFSSRYFTADFSFGLIILLQIAKFIGVDTPYMKSVWDWYENLTHCSNQYDFERYQIIDYSDFIDFYSL